MNTSGIFVLALKIWTCINSKAIENTRCIWTLCIIKVVFSTENEERYFLLKPASKLKFLAYLVSIRYNKPKLHRDLSHFALVNRYHPKLMAVVEFIEQLSIWIRYLFWDETVICVPMLIYILCILSSSKYCHI